MPHLDLNLEEIPLNTPHHARGEGMSAVIVRTEAGITAFEDYCPHAFWPLSSGYIERGRLVCPGHGWEFDAANGECTFDPGLCLTPVALSVEGETVRLKWGEEAKEES